jgi:hypothetical protein
VVALGASGTLRADPLPAPVAPPVRDIMDDDENDPPVLLMCSLRKSLAEPS